MSTRNEEAGWIVAVVLIMGILVVVAPLVAHQLGYVAPYR